MAYNTNHTGCTIDLTVHWTQKGRANFFLGDENNNESIRVVKFGLDDSDINYAVFDKPATGTVPRITGDDEDCLQSVAKCLSFNPTIPKSNKGISIIDNFKYCETVCTTICVFNFENCLNIKNTTLNEYVKYESTTHGENYNIIGATSQEFTINAWIKGEGYVVSQNEYPSAELNQNPIDGWYVKYEENAPNAVVTFYLKKGVNSVEYKATFNAFMLGDFNNVVITKHAAGYSFYLNGLKSNQVTITENNIAGTSPTIPQFSLTEDILLGYYRDANGEYGYDGFIREFFISDIAYSDDDVSQNYNDREGACPIYTDNMYVYSRMNSKSGTVALDESLYANNGELINYNTQRTTTPENGTFAPAWNCQDTCEYGEYFHHFKGNYIEASTPPELFSKFVDVSSSSRQSNLSVLSINDITGATGTTSLVPTQSINNDTTNDGYSIEFWLKIDSLPNLAAYPILTNLPNVSVSSNTSVEILQNYEKIFENAINLQSASATVEQKQTAISNVREAHSFLEKTILNSITLFAYCDYDDFGTDDYLQKYKIGAWLPSLYSGVTNEYELNLEGSNYYFPNFFFPNNVGGIPIEGADASYFTSPAQFIANKFYNFDFPYTFPQYTFDMGEWYHVVFKFKWKDSYDDSYGFREAYSNYQIRDVNSTALGLPDWFSSGSTNDDFLNTGGLFEGTDIKEFKNIPFEWGDDEWGTRLYVNGNQSYYEGNIKDASPADKKWYYSNSKPNTLYTTQGHINAPLYMNVYGQRENYNSLRPTTYNITGRTLNVFTNFSGGTLLSDDIRNSGFTEANLGGGGITGVTASSVSNWNFPFFYINNYVNSWYLTTLNSTSRLVGSAYWDTPTGISQTPIMNIDELRVYNRPLSNVEINEHYNCIFNDESNLILYYPFNETSGTTIPDSSSLNYSGSVINSSANTTTNWKSIR